MVKLTWCATYAISVQSNWKTRQRSKNDPVMLSPKFLANNFKLIWKVATSVSETECKSKNRMSRLLTFDLDLWLNKHCSVKNRVILSCSEWVFDLWLLSYDNSGSEGVLLSVKVIWLQSPMRESLHPELGSVLKFQAGKLNITECSILPIKLVKPGPISVMKGPGQLCV